MTRAHQRGVLAYLREKTTLIVTCHPRPKRTLFIHPWLIEYVGNDNQNNCDNLCICSSNFYMAMQNLKLVKHVGPIVIHLTSHCSMEGMSMLYRISFWIVKQITRLRQHNLTKLWVLTLLIHALAWVHNWICVHELWQSGLWLYAKPFWFKIRAGFAF